jgi:hypothetical protein
MDDSPVSKTGMTGSFSARKPVGKPRGRWQNGRKDDIGFLQRGRKKTGESMVRQRAEAP